MGGNEAAKLSIGFQKQKTGKDLYSFRYQVFGYENLVVSLVELKL